MRILSLVLAVCLVFGAVSFGTAACNDSLYDCPVYGITYPGTPDTDWLPGNDVSEPEAAVPAGLVLKP